MMIPMLLAIVLVGMFLIGILPGSNAREFTSHGDGDRLDAVLETLDLHDTFAGRYLRYVHSVAFKGDFGGRMGGESLGAYIFRCTKLTLKLTVLGVILSVLIGVPAGIFAAVHQNGPQDQAVSVGTLLLASVPSYCLAIFLILLFCVTLRILPAFRLDSPSAFILPAVVTASGGIAATTRMMRAATLEVLGKPYVTVLYAKGLSAANVVWRHILKNTLVTLLSTINNLFALTLGGTLIVENIFAFLGIGQMVVRAVSQRDQHLLLACMIFISVLLMLVNILCDLACALINPRIRAQYRAGGKRGGGRG